MTSGVVRIAPSILSADFARLADEVAIVEQAGADQLHVDVMDGHFVPNITLGVPVVKALKRVTKLPLDVHLMISDPDRYLDAFVDAGASMLTVHVEVLPHLHRTLTRIRELGAKADRLSAALATQFPDDNRYKVVKGDCNETRCSPNFRISGGRRRSHSSINRRPRSTGAPSISSRASARTATSGRPSCGS